MKSAQLKTKWKDPIYREHMRVAHLGQKAWNKGKKTGLVPKTAFKKGDKHTKRWYEIMKSLRGKIACNYKHGMCGTSDYNSMRANKRRTLKLKNGGKYTIKEWIELKKKYKNICLACKKKKKLVADHVIPLSRGGRNSIENIQPLCRKCNGKKYTSSTDFRNL